MDIKERMAQIMAKKRGFTDEINSENQEIINKIKSTKINAPTVAIIESHKGHGELIPSFVHYFTDLGYNVHLFCRKNTFL